MSRSLDIRIRPYEAGDEARVIALWQACGLTRPWNDPKRDIARKLTAQRELFLNLQIRSSNPGRRTSRRPASIAALAIFRTMSCRSASA